MIRSFRRTGLVFFAVLALLATTAGLVSAHAHFESSEPAPDSTVASVPTQVKVVFDNHDPLNAAGSLLVVTDAAGAVVDQGDTALDKSDADRKTLVVSLKSGLGNGTYTVAWKAASDGDGSVAEGTFKFSVGDVASAPAQLPRTGAGDSLPWALLFASALLLGLGLTLRFRIAR